MGYISLAARSAARVDYRSRARELSATTTLSLSLSDIPSPRENEGDEARFEGGSSSRDDNREKAGGG